ncbi:hypothetical protein Nepgr_003244 [Nepenthes gracilis]|uniref:Gamma-soluble NSF attachment protein n=1 Tax=Nepenthes gracilis TaxID=150966 RepID=A0AAD3RZ80_NEPGR|nr:hypothetical protein Nepgr_003244 [Nepenthes gracilis]
MAGSDPEKLMVKADKLTKLSFTRWNADWKSATLLYEQAAKGFRDTKNHEKAKLAFEKASKGQEILSSYPDSVWTLGCHLFSSGGYSYFQPLL